MKKLLLISFMLLTGCATMDTYIEAYLMKYDANEYKLVTDIRTIAEISKQDCKDQEKSKNNVNHLYVLSTSLKNYAENQPYNTPMIKSSKTLSDMVTGMYKKYNDGSKVSETFCNLKMKNIEQSAITMQKMEGSKPK